MFILFSLLTAKVKYVCLKKLLTDNWTEVALINYIAVGSFSHMKILFPHGHGEQLAPSFISCT
jgi:hypothetical protein